MNNEMTTREVDSLIEWLVANGHTYEEAAACVKFIASRNK